MGYKKFLKKRFIPGYKSLNTINHIIEDGLVDGTRKAIKECWIYKKGKHDGKKKGYISASKEYEKKLLKQADEFLQQTKIYEVERQAYENLLNEYETEIERLINKVQRTKSENEFLQQLLMKERRLKNMARV